MGFTRKHLQVNSVTGDVSKVRHQFIGSKWDTDKSSNHYGILVSSVVKKLSLGFFQGHFGDWPKTSLQILGG